VSPLLPNLPDYTQVRLDRRVAQLSIDIAPLTGAPLRDFLQFLLRDETVQNGVVHMLSVIGQAKLPEASERLAGEGFIELNPINDQRDGSIIDPGCVARCDGPAGEQWFERGEFLQGGVRPRMLIAATVVFSFFPAISTGTISSAKNSLSVARAVRIWLRHANASCASRATLSPVSGMESVP
jgi:hypothetical protein